MAKWQVRLHPLQNWHYNAAVMFAPEPQIKTVEADDVDTSNGTLYLLDAAGQPVYTAPHGQWIDCELIAEPAGPVLQEPVDAAGIAAQMHADTREAMSADSDCRFAVGSEADQYAGGRSA